MSFLSIKISKKFANIQNKSEQAPLMIILCFFPLDVTTAAPTDPVTTGRYKPVFFTLGGGGEGGQG